MKELPYWLALNAVSVLGSRRIRKLIDFAGSAGKLSVFLKKKFLKPVSRKKLLPLSFAKRLKSTRSMNCCVVRNLALMLSRWQTVIIPNY